jgi:sulfonate transport system permease protein
MRRLGLLALEAWLPVAIVLFWYFASNHSHSAYWPPLREIWQAVEENWFFAHFDTDLVPTMRRVAEGFAVAVVIGVGVGAALGVSPLLRRMFEPTLEFIRATPGVAMIPISIFVFGINDSQKVFVIAFVSVWAILLNTTEGVRGIDQSFHDMAHVYGLRRRERILRLILPAALPQMFAGLRVALAQALLVGVVAELFASRNGLGRFILQAQGTFQIKDMWSGIIVLAFVAYLINLVFVMIERRVLYWHRGWRASVLGEGGGG